MRNIDMPESSLAGQSGMINDQTYLEGAQHREEGTAMDFGAALEAGASFYNEPAQVMEGANNMTALDLTAKLFDNDLFHQADVSLLEANKALQEEIIIADEQPYDVVDQMEDYMGDNPTPIMEEALQQMEDE
jgi:hypothetical protein